MALSKLSCSALINNSLSANMEYFAASIKLKDLPPSYSNWLMVKLAEFALSSSKFCDNVALKLGFIKDLC